MAEQRARRARGLDLDEHVRRLQHRPLDRVDRPRRRVAAGETRVPVVVAVGAPHREHFEVGTGGERLAGELGPADHRDRPLVREGEQRGQTAGGAVVAHEPFGLPCRVRRVGRRQHPRAEPPQRRAIGVVHEQASAGDHEPGGVHVELGEAVGGFGDERAVVAGMPGDATQALEGLHERQPTRSWPGARLVRARSVRSRNLLLASAAMAQRVSLPPVLADAGVRAERRILTLLDAEIDRWRAIDADLEEPLVALRDLVSGGGKRFRPAFCFWAFVGAGGDPLDDVVVDVCAAIEMVHACALVHDDVMDGAATRRGRPSVHQRFVDHHTAADAHGEARRFGEGAAILIGDFAFVYADMLFASAPPSARPVYDDLRIELCVGQFLDLAGAASTVRDRGQAERIEVYKSGKYTVERPLHLGAALAGRLDDLAGPFTAFGIPLGSAFQMRDDLLGVFGDPAVTGKPVGDDLREGKLTPLLAAATDLATGAQADLLARAGSPDLGADEIAALQDLLVELGAVDEVERTIRRLVDESLAALHAAPITAEAQDALEQLAMFVAWRDA